MTWFKNICISFIKILIAVALTPLACGLSVALYKSVSTYFDVYSLMPFVFGFFSYLLIYAVLQQPIRTYVFTHELVHVIWVFLFGGKVKGFKLHKNGGSVKVTKSNFVIELAPYFFPLYCVLVIFLYLFLDIFFEMKPYWKLMSFLVGFMWAFHFTITLYVLTKEQTDFQGPGVVLSLVIVYISNVVILSLMLCFLSKSTSFGSFFRDSMEYSVKSYGQFINACSQLFERTKL
ncbi:hypothetical protein M0R36_08245 [bacterium]|jgi:hypothetical protein|nr:hypothetical protein [bacterium]